MHDPLENIKQGSHFPLLLLLFQSLRQQIRWELLGDLTLTFCAADRDGSGLQMFTGPYGICMLSSGIIMKYTVLEGKDNLIININQCSCSLNDCKSVRMEFQTFPVFIHWSISFHTTLQVKIYFSNNSLVTPQIFWKQAGFLLTRTSELRHIVQATWNSYREIWTSGFPSTNLLSCFSL